MVIAFLFFSCDNVRNKKENQFIDDKQLELSLEEMNRKMLQYESELIDDYIEKNNLKVQRTGTGLRYQIVNEGKGDLIP